MRGLPYIWELRVKRKKSKKKKKEKEMSISFNFNIHACLMSQFESQHMVVTWYMLLKFELSILLEYGFVPMILWIVGYLEISK